MSGHAGGPVWLLDVDGVVNASRPGWHAAPYQGTVRADSRSWKFRWDPSVTSFIREVALAELAEVRWSSTWVPWRAGVERTLRLPELPVAFAIDEGKEQDVDALKRSAALAVVEQERRPLVWTDDDVVPGFGPLRDRLEAAGVPLLLIAPAFARGLRPDDIETIRAFLVEHGRWGGSSV